MIRIYKGDDGAFAGMGYISVSILTAIDTTGFTGRFDFLGVSKDFSEEEIALRKFTFTYTAEETAGFCLGQNFGTFTLFDAEDRKACVSRILVEVLPGCPCSSCSCNEVLVSLDNAFDYGKMGNKPVINGVTLEGDHNGAHYGLASEAQGKKADTAIQGVKVNGTVIEPDEGRFVNIPKQEIVTDDAVTKDSANPVKSSGIWSAIWGALSELPAGVSSLYDWCVAQLAGKADKSALGEKADLVDGKVPSEQLPATFDDVQFYDVKDNPASGQTSFPATGDGERLYIAKDTNKCWRWNGSAYIEVSDATLTEVVGDVVVWFADGTSVSYGSSGNEIVYTAPSGGEVLTFKGPVDGKSGTAAQGMKFWVVDDGHTPLPSEYDPYEHETSWCLYGSGSTPDGMMYWTGPTLTISNWSSEDPTLTAGIGTTVSGAMPMMSRPHSYVLGTQSSKALQPAGDYARKEDMAASKIGALPTTGGTMTGHISFGDDSGLSLQANRTDHRLPISDNYDENVVYIKPTRKTDNASLASLKDIAPAYNSSTSYVVGKLCIKDDELVKCTTAGTGSAAVFDEATVEDVLSALRTGKADASALLDKLDSTSAAPAFSSDSSTQYAVGKHVVYNGKLYVCTTATTGGTWVAGSWTADTMTDPDAVLDITAQNQLRVVAKDGTLLWAQGYDLASSSSATLACDAVNNFTFADGATTQAFTLPTAPTSKVGDFGLDIDNSANTGAATITLTGLDTTFSVVVPEGESLNDMLAIAAGELARFYVTLTTFRVNSLPTWHIVKQVVENGGATA